MQKRNIFIALATGILGGPGKGLEQFLRHGGLEKANPLVANYKLENENETDFERVMKNTGAKIVQLYQQKALDYNLVTQAEKIIKENKIEILQSHGYKSHALCYILHKKTKLPWLAFVHGWTHENLKMRLYCMLEQVLLLGASEVVAVSDSLQSRLIAPVRKRAKVIPNALASSELVVTRSREEIRKELNVSEDTTLICIVGRLSPEKNHAMFFKGIASLIKQGKKIHALVIGNGQEYDNLQTLITELNIKNNISFIGHVQDTANYYNASDMQVMTSTTEGMPNVALEGMYMGLPLVATNVGGIPEVVIDEETGILIPNNDDKALSEAIIKLMEKPELMASFSKAAKERIEKHFNPYERANKILSLYDSLYNKYKKEV